jgi:hypothetical protein
MGLFGPLRPPTWTAKGVREVAVLKILRGGRIHLRDLIRRDHRRASPRAYMARPSNEPSDPRPSSPTTRRAKIDVQLCLLTFSLASTRIDAAI